MPIDFDRATDRVERAAERAARTIITRAPLVPRSVIAAVGLGAAFGVGLLVGGRDARADDVDPQVERDVLSIASERSKELEETRAKLKLTFPTELQTTDAPRIEKLTANAQAEARKSAAKSTSTSAAVEPKHDDAAEPIEPPPAPAPATTSPAANAPAKADDDDGEDRDLADAGSLERRTPERLQAAIAKVVGEPAAASATSSSANATSGSSASGTFALQVAAAPTRAGAEAMAAKLATEGHKARVVEGDVGGKAVFRVRIGPFGERAAADAYKAKLDKPAFVVRE